MTATPNAHARRVLVVEDEARLRDLWCRALPDMGFQVQGARSAELALGILEHERHDILLLDLNLPGMGGLALFEHVHTRWPEIAVIIITGFGDLDAACMAIRLDVVDFLKKPCSLGDLDVALHRATGLRGHFPFATRSCDAGPGAEVSGAWHGCHGTLEEIERREILAALERNGGNRAKAAKDLGISTRTLYYRISSYRE